MSPDHFLPHVGHGLEASAIRFTLGSANDDGVHAIRIQIANFPEWRLDLSFLRVHLHFALPPHNRAGIIKQLFEF